jgi:hypothetical protein
MWFEEDKKGPNKGDPFNYSTHTIETKVKKEIVSNKSYLTSAPKSPIRRSEHSGKFRLHFIACEYSPNF